MSGFERLGPPAGVFGSFGSGINAAGQVSGSVSVSGPLPVRWRASGQVQVGAGPTFHGFLYRNGTFGISTT